MSDEYLFTCKECGSHELKVVCRYKVDEEYNNILPCTCGGENDGLAAEQTIYVTIDYEDYGYLDEDHRWEVEYEREELDRCRYDEEPDVYCQECFENYCEDYYLESLDEEDVINESTEFWVYCSGCQKEIEFGWSHPYRGGRIWPSECVDFNPWKCWPEPRYQESWRKKNWLRPSQ